MRRVRLRGPAHLEAFSMTALEGVPTPEVAPPAGHEDRPRLRGPQHHPAAIAGRVSQIGIGAMDSRDDLPDGTTESGWEWDETVLDCPSARILERFLAGMLGDREEEHFASTSRGAARARRTRQAGRGRESTSGDLPARGCRTKACPLVLESLKVTPPGTGLRHPPLGSKRHAQVGRLGDSRGTTLVAWGPGLGPGLRDPRRAGPGRMGVVYKARQLSLGRLTALKMILAGEHAGPGRPGAVPGRGRGGGLAAPPHIVQVYETGEAGGLLYFLDGVRRGADARAAVARDTADRPRGGPAGGGAGPGRRTSPTVGGSSTATSSRRMSCSRPSTRRRRRSPPGRPTRPPNSAAMGLVPKIADFGLAKRIGDPLGTRTGQVMGTPSYMSPEQLAGRRGATGPGVDIYALGCILYEALTGRPPFLDASLEVLAVRVRREEPIPPRTSAAQVPARPGDDRPEVPREGARAAVCDRRRAGGRPPAVPRREPIAARPPSSWDRLIKLVRRNRAAVAGLAGIIASLLLGIAATGYLAWREGRARRTGRRRRRRGP